MPVEDTAPVEETKTPAGVDVAGLKVTVPKESPTASWSVKPAEVAGVAVPELGPPG